MERRTEECEKMKGPERHRTEGWRVQSRAGKRWGHEGESTREGKEGRGR